MINIGKTELFSHTHARGERVEMCVPGEMHTKRQMHSAQSIKMQMSFIRGGNICVGRESVFRLSVGPIHPCGIRARMYTRHPGSGSCRAVTMGRTNPRRKCHGIYGTLFRPNLYFTTDSAYQWQPRRQGPHHDFQGET